MILKAQTWHLWRQDDNGHHFLVVTFVTLAAAEAMMAELMRGHHKQTYWVSEEAETEQ